MTDIIAIITLIVTSIGVVFGIWTYFLKKPLPEETKREVDNKDVPSDLKKSLLSLLSDEWEIKIVSLLMENPKRYFSNKDLCIKFGLSKHTTSRTLNSLNLKGVIEPNRTDGKRFVKWKIKN